MLLESKSIRDVFIRALDEYRLNYQRATSSTTKASFEGVIRVLETLLVTIHRAEQANTSQEEFMDKIQNELVAQIVSIDDIEVRRRSSELEAKIKDIVDKLPEGKAALMTEKIKYGHLATKVSQMKKENKGIPDNISVVKRGDKVYLQKK